MVNRRKLLLINRAGEEIVIAMDLYKLRTDNPAKYPEDFRLSWIAFDPKNPRAKRILLDSHPPKGPHFHIDNRITEIPFSGLSLKESETLFFEIVCEHFNISPEELK